MSIVSIDARELACHLCKLDWDSEYNELEQAIFDNYEVSMDSFDAIVRDLLPLIDVGVSPLTGTKFKGFSKIEDGHGFWLVKMEVPA